ncbi:DUF3718 domain-containing protein [Ferrimonas aestuarii]|uniref:DUF3718 domain-containing protein n=1 Tax=Ferrimonas aestuarii TaxID=2569539 RepID=A0A4U1BHC1_9GAMM|nr:DUF3718 domain-containing protein [Ferrimonas aestuarii]TKB50794.1 DUF3718 domain-containing protein [Ferrimonas aestuarii]
MKMLTTLAVAALFAFPAQAKFTPAMEQSLIETCKASLTNSKVQFRNAMRTYRVNPYRVLPKLVCNGEDVASFAESYGATKISSYVRTRYYRGQVSITDIAMTQPKYEVWYTE